jgi:hypothetical protein
MMMEHNESSEEEWCFVYNIEDFEEYCTEELAFLSTGKYYQTYGGGPEGGFVELPTGEVYSVKRSWGIPFTATKLAGKLEKKMTHNPPDPVVTEVRLVPARVENQLVINYHFQTSRSFGENISVFCLRVFFVFSVCPFVLHVEMYCLSISFVEYC